MLTFNMDLNPNWIGNIGLYKVKNDNIYNATWVDVNILSNSAELIGNKDYVEMFDCAKLRMVIFAMLCGLTSMF